VDQSAGERGGAKGRDTLNAGRERLIHVDTFRGAYAGLELFRHFLDRSGVAARLKQVFSLRQFDGDYALLGAAIVIM
jgi:hypothetical protein